MFDFMKNKESVQPVPSNTQKIHRPVQESLPTMSTKRTRPQIFEEYHKQINKTSYMGINKIIKLGKPYDSPPIDFESGRARIDGKVKLSDKNYRSSLSALSMLMSGEPLISKAVNEGCARKGGAKTVVRGVIKHIYPESYFLKNCIKPDNLPPKKNTSTKQDKPITLAAILDLVPLDKGYESVDLRVSSNLVTKLQLASVFTKQLTGSIVEAALGEYFKTMELNK